MADLTSSDQHKLERLLGMGSGYVLDFSNRTFAEFMEECVRRSIFDARYDYGSGSTANRLRAFWSVEGIHLVGKLIEELISFGQKATCSRMTARCRRSAGESPHVLIPAANGRRPRAPPTHGPTRLKRGRHGRRMPGHRTHICTVQ